MEKFAAGNAEIASEALQPRPRSSSRSKYVMAMIRLGKLSIFSRLLLREVRALSPPIRGRDLRLPGHDLQLDFAVHDLGRDLFL
ncbi:unnamed protein product [Linum trigynum]|uniref:Uncharacterized protein n=1 Tax=Linum trigynum TaxID=586398 RepID=A0AAV2CL74_9ROSI